MTACKRVLSVTGPDPDGNPKEKRLRPSLSFHSVIVDVMRVKCFQQTFSLAFEPLLRRVVREEVDEAIRRKILTISKSPSIRIKDLEQNQAPNLKLVFSKQLSLPIFTGTKIHDRDSNSLQIMLMREENGHSFQEIVPYPLKIELVAIDGDFSIDTGSWRTEEFEAKIIKERAGRRPLLAGELVYTMKDGLFTIGDIEFTDNSSWIRGRKYRLGARVVMDGSNGVGILEAVSEPFVVRDHRGELYKKHYPPILSDKVWRLEKIGKDGTFHQKLTTHGIKTVEDFLKLYNFNSNTLRKILGQGMSDKMWEVTLNHAKTCVVTPKVYMLRGLDHELALNPICQVMWANIDGHYYTPSQDSTLYTKMRVEELVKVAYENWGSLEVSTTSSLNYSSCNWGNEAQMVIGLGGEYFEQNTQILTTNNMEMGCVFYSNNNSFHNFSNSSH